jgi:hypothetical protein
MKALGVQEILAESHIGKYRVSWLCPIHMERKYHVRNNATCLTMSFEKGRNGVFYDFP